MLRDHVLVILVLVLARRWYDRFLPILVLIYRLSTHTFVVIVIVSRGAASRQIFILKGLLERNGRDRVRLAPDIIMVAAATVGDAARLQPLLLFVALEDLAVVLFRVRGQLHHHYCTAVFTTTFLSFKV